MKAAISFLKSNNTPEETLRMIDNTDSEYLHVDVMDGEFVENKNFEPLDLVRLLVPVKKPLDVHLMVVDPIKYINAIKDLNILNITVHAELEKNLGELIDYIHSYGIGAGLAINPETPVKKIKRYLDDVQYVIVMSVHPGKGGQKLIEETTSKLKELKDLKKEYGLKLEICVDGGVNKETRHLVDDADVIVLGSAVCLSEDYQSTIDEIR